MDSCIDELIELEQLLNSPRAVKPFVIGVLKSASTAGLTHREVLDSLDVVKAVLAQDVVTFAD